MHLEKFDDHIDQKSGKSALEKKFDDQTFDQNRKNSRKNNKQSVKSQGAHKKPTRQTSTYDHCQIYNFFKHSTIKIRYI